MTLSLPLAFIIAGVVCAVLSVFTRVPLWVGVLLLGVGAILRVS